MNRSRASSENRAITSAIGASFNTDFELTIPDVNTMPRPPGIPTTEARFARHQILGCDPAGWTVSFSGAGILTMARSFSESADCLVGKRRMACQEDETRTITDNMIVGQDEAGRMDDRSAAAADRAVFAPCEE